jgi:hypothetical protein
MWGPHSPFEKQVQNWGRNKRLALIEWRLEDLVRLARGTDRDAWDAAHRRHSGN